MRAPRQSPLALAAVLAAVVIAGCEEGNSASPPASGPASGASSGAGRVGGAAEAGGEKSIEGFGTEAEGGEHSAVLATFTGYLDAIASKDYASACEDLTATVQASLKQFAPPRLKAKSCEEILPGLLSPAAAPIARSQAEGNVTRVRVKENRGFVVFHAPGAKLYQLPMVREGGAWKVGLVTASVLVPSAER